MSLTFKIDNEKRFVQIDTDGVVTLGAWVCTFAHLEPCGPIAIVSSNEESDLFIRRFMNLGGAKRPIRLFASMDEARTWLAATPEA